MKFPVKLLQEEIQFLSFKSDETLSDSRHRNILRSALNRFIPESKMLLQQKKIGQGPIYVYLHEEAIAKQARCELRVQ